MDKVDPMQIAEQDAQVVSKLAATEQKLGELATPVGETFIARAFGPKGEVFYAVQPYRYKTTAFDYYAVRLRKLGHLRFIGNRRKPQFITVGTRSTQYSITENTAYALVQPDKGIVTLGPKGQILISDADDRNMGIGSFALSLLVRWLKLNYPELRVGKGLLAEDGSDMENRLRRDRLLQNAGLSVVYTNRAGRGYFYANSVEELREHLRPEKIDEISMEGFFSIYSSMQELHHDLSKEHEEAHRKIRHIREQEIPRLLRQVHQSRWVALFIGLVMGIAGGYLLATHGFNIAL